MLHFSKKINLYVTKQLGNKMAKGVDPDQELPEFSLHFLLRPLCSNILNFHGKWKMH